MSNKDLGNYIGVRVSITSIIRSVIEYKDDLNILLYYGSCTFNNSYFEINIKMTKKDLKVNGIDVKLIVTEKLILKKVIIRRVK